MADVPILVTGTGSTPVQYEVPNTQEIMPKVVSAVFDGTSAASSFEPTLEIVNDGGIVVAEIPAGLVQPGGAERVSWFPGAEVEEESALASAYTTAVMALGPWAYWKLADGASSGILVDSSGHGRTLGYHASTVTLGQPGLIPTSSDTCMLEALGGAPNIQEMPSLNTQTFSASSVSLEFWINTAGNPGNEMVLACFGRLDNEQNWMARLNGSGQPEFSFIDSGSVAHTFTFAAGLADSITHQLVMVMDGTNVLCYKDGVLFGSTAAGASLNVPATHTVCLGQPLGGVVTRWYGGLIGPCVVYDKALSASQIANLYANATGTLSGGAVASVTAGDSSIVIGGTGTNPTVETASLDVIATDHPTGADWSNNSKKITSVHDPTAAQDAATKNYVDTHSGTGISTINSPGSTISVTNPTGPTTSLDLPTSGVGAATYGDSTHVSQVTVNNKGIVTAAANVAIQGVGPTAPITQVAAVVLGADTATISASGIAGSYSSLLVQLYIQSNYTGANFDNINLTFNGDTSTSNYEWASGFNGTSAGSKQSSTTGSIQMNNGVSTNHTVAGDFTPWELTIPQYANAVGFKVLSGTGGLIDGVERQSLYLTGTWKSTSAITSMSFAPSNGTAWKTGTALYIFGLQA